MDRNPGSGTHDWMKERMGTGCHFTQQAINTTIYAEEYDENTKFNSPGRNSDDPAVGNVDQVLRRFHSKHIPTEIPDYSSGTFPKAICNKKISLKNPIKPHDTRQKSIIQHSSNI